MELAEVHSPIVALYVSVFLTQMCLGVAFIATPILALEMEAAPFLIGLIGASGGAAYAVMTRVFGSASDRFSRKKMLFAALVVQAISMALCFLSQDPYQLLFARFVLALGAALFWPLAEASVGDLAVAGQLDRALTGYNVSWSSATIVGPQLGGLFIVWFFTRMPFLVALSVFFLAAMLLLPRALANVDKSIHVPPPDEDEQTFRESSKVLPLICAFLLAFAGAILSALFPAYASQLGVSADLIGFMFLLSGGTQTLMVFLANQLHSRIGERIMLLLSSFFFFCALTIIGLAPVIPLFFVGFIIFGFGQGIGYPTAILSVLRGSGSNRGKAAGTFESMLGIGFLTGPLVGGAFYQMGGSLPYIFGSLVSIAITAPQLFMILRSARSTS